LSLLTANTKACNAHDNLGLLPLHKAIQHKSSESTILRILEANKKAAKVPDTYGILPIQMAVESKLSDLVLLALLHANEDVFKNVKPSVTIAVLRDKKCDTIDDSDDSSDSEVNEMTPKSTICLPQPPPEYVNDFFQESIILHDNNDTITCAETLESFSVVSMT
jgi:hypothetical protein